MHYLHFLCSFPKDESMRNKWIESLKLSKTNINFKTAHICSDHFDEKLFFHHDEQYSITNRLHPDAVPQLIKVKPSSKLCDFKESDVLQDIKLESNLDESSEISKFSTTDKVCARENCSQDLSNPSSHIESNLSSTSTKR